MDRFATPDEEFVALRTDRLVIRRFHPADAASFAAYRSDPAVARYQGWELPVPLERAREFISQMQALHPLIPGEWFQFAIAEADGGAHVGDVAAQVDGQDPRQARVGVTVASGVQGRGYATEALRALLDYLFVAHGKHRVVADCDVRNTASVALLERLGMRREAHHLQSAWFGGEWTDEYVYALLAAEWVPAER